MSNIPCNFFIHCFRQVLILKQCHLHASVGYLAAIPQRELYGEHYFSYKIKIYEHIDSLEFRNMNIIFYKFLVPKISRLMMSILGEKKTFVIC